MTAASISAPQKTCRKCLELYSETRCQPCYKKQRAGYRAQNAEKISAAKARYRQENSEALRLKNQLWRAANKDRVAEAARRNYRNNAEKIKAERAAYYQVNRDAAIARVTAYRLANPEKVRLAQRKSMARYKVVNREKLRAIGYAYYRENLGARKAYAASYYAKNRAFILQSRADDQVRNPAKYHSWQFKYKAANRQKYRAYQQNRRARELSCSVGLSPDLAARLLVSQKGRCACCGKRLTKYHMDHIIPLSQGGANEDSNIQLLTPRCNLQKGAKHPGDFMRQRGFLL